MIEIIYNESGKAGAAVVIKPPKNIRQIGSPRGRHKIYMEDYVNTFLHMMTGEEGGKNSEKRNAEGGETNGGKKVFVLLGRSEVSQDIRYTFVSGAIRCEKFVLCEGGIRFNENSWEYIYKEMKQYFDRQEIVGWGVDRPGETAEMTPDLEAVYRKYFLGKDKIALVLDTSEGEENFYALEQGGIQKKEGYYIFYEKNPAMQEYMVSRREKEREAAGGIKANEEWEIEKIRRQEREEGAEPAIQNYRNMLQGKREQAQKKSGKSLLYLAASAAMIVLCVIGITSMSNYEKMKEVEQVLSTMAGVGVQGDETETKGREETLVVGSVPGFLEDKVLKDVSGQEKEGGESSESVKNGRSSNQGDGKESNGQKNAPQAEPKNLPEVTSAAEEAPSQEEDLSQEETSSQTQDQDEAEEGQDADSVQPTSAQEYLEQGYYIVQPGDRLETICKMLYQTTAMMDKLCEVNQITDVDKIFAGQKLMLP